MTISPVEFDPTDLVGQEERAVERQRQAIAAATERRDDLVWLLSDPRGRREIRQRLREAGFDVTRDEVVTVFNHDHGTMCYHEGLRTQALRLLWPIMRLMASRRVSAETVRLLMTEGQDE